MSEEAKQINEAILVVQGLLESERVRGCKVVADELAKMELGFHRQLHTLQNKPKRSVRLGVEHER